MTPGTVVLLHSPHGAADGWGDLPEMLRSYGLDVIAPDVPDAAGPRYVARASLVIAATDPSVPLVLVGHGAAGPLLPAVALAQRAAHRGVGGYVFVDADLPRPRRGHEHDHEEGHGEPPAPVPADWPDAPCGYLWTHADRTAGSAERERSVREARLRGWTVVEHEPPAAAAQSLSELIATL
ncbi:hypothetical protein GCM10009678_57240 [Actinomadura kijaniata]|uniref:Alpha/beta hydrolase n=1 Tax=Actinomadura namibiensis TaxID=182080 RepID=A0A7W3QKP8_ACTNM|nr:hypothetical protein [Actinomadura namibiensis]MBA8950158.1 hypothetical protein [Actinomadura namibiensis]